MILSTPCKINPSVTSVLSARKPRMEDDPLQRLQSSTQGKEEMVMYCKSKVYAGVEEFSIEEIRAEIYMAKVRKKREGNPITQFYSIYCIFYSLYWLN